MGAGAVVDMSIVREAGRDGIEVVLDGQTGDETLGFAPYLVSDRLRQGRLIAALRLTGRWPLGRPTTLRERRWVLNQIGLKGAVPYRLGNAVKSLRRKDGDPGPAWLAPHLRRPFVEQQDRWAWKVGSSGPRWWRYLSDKIVEGPHRDLRMDYLRHRGAAAGVHNDSPLYDFDVVDYCLKLPPDLAFASERSRPLARHALRDLMPDEVRLSHEKADFSSFCFEMLSNADAPGIERILDAPDPELGAYVDMDWVRRLWHHERPAAGKHTGFWGTLIWLMTSGECWLRAQADAGFAERMLAHDDVRSPSLRRISPAENGTFFRLAGSGNPV
jgi:asparagine synthetase B (glutamine-hydrolysing)